MNKEIIVYYGMNHFVNLAAPRFENPHPLNVHCLKGKKEEDYSYQTCPSFHTFIKNVFVLKPSKIIEKYKTDMEYTDWTKETRSTQEETYTI